MNAYRPVSQVKNGRWFCMNDQTTLLSCDGAAEDPFDDFTDSLCKGHSPCSWEGCGDVGFLVYGEYVCETHAG